MFQITNQFIHIQMDITMMDCFSIDLPVWPLIFLPAVSVPEILHEMVASKQLSSYSWNVFLVSLGTPMDSENFQEKVWAKPKSDSSPALMFKLSIWMLRLKCLSNIWKLKSWNMVKFPNWVARRKRGASSLSSISLWPMRTDKSQGKSGKAQRNIWYSLICSASSPNPQLSDLVNSDLVTWWMMMMMMMMIVIIIIIIIIVIKTKAGFLADTVPPMLEPSIPSASAAAAAAAIAAATWSSGHVAIPRSHHHVVSFPTKAWFWGGLICLEMRSKGLLQQY